MAVLWRRFGPYHLARLRGAAEILASSSWAVRGVEIAEKDEYCWKRAIDSNLPRATLFPGREYSTLGKAAIRRKVLDHLDRLRPSALCVNGWSVVEAVAALKWCIRNGSQAILMSETFQSSRNPLKLWVKRQRLGRFDAAIVGGRWHAAYLTMLGYPLQRVQLGYDVVDNQHFASGQRRSRCVCGVEVGYIFANTRFLTRKGIDALLRAYARYRQLDTSESRELGQPWHLVISGSGPMELQWKKLASELGVSEAVHWPGFLQYEALPSAYRSASLFVHPARREAWGLVVNEAAAAGLPVIVGHRVGAVCELVRDGENGFVVEPDDTEAFARLLLRVRRMPRAQRAQMGFASQRIVSAFGPERFGRALERLLSSRSHQGREASA